MKTVYQAEDGTIFEEEESCILHESKRLRMYDENGRRINNTDLMIYVFLETEEEVDLLIDLLDREGATTEGLEKPGFYGYINYEYHLLSADMKPFERMARDN